MKNTFKELKRNADKRKIAIVLFLISALSLPSCCHSSYPDLLYYDIEYLAGYFYWTHNKAPANIHDIIIAYEELQQEWPHNPHSETYLYLCKHPKSLFLFEYNDKYYFVDLNNVSYNVIPLKKSPPTPQNY